MGADRVISTALSNVPLSTAEDLAFVFLGVVAVYLISGPLIVVLYRRKLRKEKAAAAPAPSG